jgi:hypothetical protein
VKKYDRNTDHTPEIFVAILFGVLIFGVLFAVTHGFGMGR